MKRAVDVVRQALPTRIEPAPPGATCVPSVEHHESLDLKRLLATASQDADLFKLDLDPDVSMLSPAEIAVVFALSRHVLRHGSRVAELGAYTGGTTVVFGEALRRLESAQCRLEVYDFFEHNSTSRKRLSKDPLFDENSFYAIWQRTADRYLDLVDLHRGDLRQTALEAKEPLDILYVGVVKHESLINPVMNDFLPRLRSGGLLIHQDYFHWQSPWVVYATEAVLSHFEILGSVSNHMLVLRARGGVPTSDLQMDYLDGLARTDKIGLMRRAIERNHGIRRGLLRVSLVNLAADWDEFDVDAEIVAIRREHSEAPRVLRYLDEALRVSAARSTTREIW